MDEKIRASFQKVKGIEITTRKMVEEYFSGKYESVFKGTGMNFSDVREYQAGDDVRAIDWNVTARLGRPFIKQFVEERELTIMLAVDISGSQYFGTHEKSKAELACEIAAILAFSALRNQDKVGLLMFSDGIEKYLPPRKQKGYVLRIIREILYRKPKEHKTNLNKTLRYLNEMMHKKGIIFLISDYIDSDFEKTLRITNRKHDLIAVTISDPIEEKIPDIGLIEMEDPESGAIITIDSSDPKLRNAFSKSVEERKNELRTLFGKAGIDAIDLKTDQDYIKPLYSFFKMREGRRR